MFVDVLGFLFVIFLLWCLRNMHKNKNEYDNKLCIKAYFSNFFVKLDSFLCGICVLLLCVQVFMIPILGMQVIRKIIVNCSMGCEIFK